MISMKGKANQKYILLLISVVAFLVFYFYEGINQKRLENEKEATSYTFHEIPSYFGEPYVILNDNIPSFDEKDYQLDSFEHYSDLDSLGRSGVAYANIGVDLMPTKKRTSIGMIRPTGWHTVKYDTILGKYLYNRCHLIGYQLTGENANEKNLITCTRSMNTEGMLPFEDKVADYIRETKNHVLYRVTPLFEGDNLLTNGVEIEAYSIEDKGEGIQFHVYVYNVQDNIEIDYKTGESKQRK